VTATELDTRAGDLTSGRGFDVVIDPVGGRLRAQALTHLAPFGRLVILGNASGDDPALSGDAVWHGTCQVLGLSLGNVAHLLGDEARHAMTAVLALARCGLLGDLRPSIRPLSDVTDVHRDLEARKAPAKTVLAIAGRPEAR
jgi:NADPH:quinone reductase